MAIASTNVDIKYSHWRKKPSTSSKNGTCFHSTEISSWTNESFAFWYTRAWRKETSKMQKTKMLSSCWPNVCFLSKFGFLIVNLNFRHIILFQNSYALERAMMSIAWERSERPSEKSCKRNGKTHRSKWLTKLIDRISFKWIVLWWIEIKKWEKMFFLHLQPFQIQVWKFHNLSTS